MVNSSYITRKMDFSVKQIDKDLHDIIERRLDGLFDVEFCNGIDSTYGFWQIRYKDIIYLSFDMWLETKKKLELRHPANDYMYWVQMVITNELAVKYNGTISDEGVEEIWKGDTGKYPAYSSWVREFYSNFPNMKAEDLDQAVNTQIGMQIKHLPEELKRLEDNLTKEAAKDRSRK